MFSRLYLLLSFCIVSISFSQAQECGVDLAEGALIKQRMLDNRARTEGLNLRQQTTIYLPISFHLVGTSAGADYPDEINVLDALCGLNTNFEPYDIQFYIANLVYFPNDIVYGDGLGSGPSSEMAAAKVANTINVFVGDNVSSNVLGYYSRSNDFIFVRKTVMDLEAKTFSHEVGHFLTLPHTFYGWEGTTVEDEYGVSPAPTSLGNRDVEYVTRNGANANCNSAADGFCDTEADYFSDRLSCPLAKLAFDPDSVLIVPSETNYMSYFLNSCRSDFTTEQVDAMLADILIRGWSNGSLPANLTAIPDSLVLTNINPLNNSAIELSGDIVLSWDAVPGAQGYWVEAHRTFSGSIIETISTELVTNPTLTLSSNDLQINRDYVWTVKPYNAYWTCNQPIETFSFNTIAPATTVYQTELQNSIEMRVTPNPISNSMLSWFIISDKIQSGDVRLYNSNGQIVMNMENLELSQGENNFQIDLVALPKGIYLLSFQTINGEVITSSIAIQ